MTATGGVPPNDAFANAQVITGNSGTITATNTGATKQTGEPNHAGNAGGGSIWYAWTPTVGGSVTIDTVGSSFDTIMGVYTGTAVNALTTVASNDDIASGTTASRVTFNVAAGTTYRIAIDGYNGLRGNVTLNWVLTPAGVPPANDAFANAQVLTGATGTITATNVNATKETGEPAQAGNAGGARSGTPGRPPPAGRSRSTPSAAPSTPPSASTPAPPSTPSPCGPQTTTSPPATPPAASPSPSPPAPPTASAVDGYNARQGAITLNWVGPAGTTTQPQITTQPANQSVTAGGTATFTAAASGTPTPTVQWQVSTDGGTSYSDIAGATSATLTLTAVTTAQNTNRYRAVFTNSAGGATTNAATLDGHRRDPAAADHHPAGQPVGHRRRHGDVHRRRLRHPHADGPVAGLHQRRHQLQRHRRRHLGDPHPHRGDHRPEHQPLPGGVHQQRRQRHHQRRHA